jgi:arabinose-5-phosphate isomerase
MTVSQTSAVDDVASACRVLLAEAAALNSLAAALGAPLRGALDLLTVDGGGRVIVCGMGKSGHVARKIAATLASTGTPSLYVHPGEASHGDLGMITLHDAILALSNSGETPELSDVVNYSRRFAIPLVVITSRANSTLAQAADLALVLPDVGEACPMGLAPTTSTTMMMALGDALAVALLERKGFSSADFRVFHPGGMLGRRLLRVADLMHIGDELPLVGLDMPMSEAILVMTRKSFGCVGVQDADGRLAGVITDGDLRRQMEPGLFARQAEDLMTRGPKTVRAKVLAAEALLMMNSNSITSLFVLGDDGRPVGILHMHDCLRAGIA